MAKVVLFLLSLWVRSDLWPYQPCLKVFSVLPMYVFVVVPDVTVALYITASCRQWPSRGHSAGFWQLHAGLLGVLVLLFLFWIFVLWPEMIAPMLAVVR